MSRPMNDMLFAMGKREPSEMWVACGQRCPMAATADGLPPVRSGPCCPSSDQARAQRYTRSGKKSSISRAADSGESEPCTRFSWTSSAKSPRIVPGAAATGSVAPASGGTPSMARWPSATSGDQRARR